MTEEEEALLVLGGINLSEIVEELKKRTDLLGMGILETFNRFLVHDRYLRIHENGMSPFSRVRKYLIKDFKVHKAKIEFFPAKYRKLAEIIVKDFKRRGERLINGRE
jgi:hypothetical protein